MKFWNTGNKEKDLQVPERKEIKLYKQRIKNQNGVQFFKNNGS